MVPDLRPSSPFSTGPTLFLASAPTEWQGRHFLNEFSPAARSCAKALPAGARATTAASANLYIPVVLDWNDSALSCMAFGDAIGPGRGWPARDSHIPAPRRCPIVPDPGAVR